MAMFETNLHHFNWQKSVWRRDSLANRIRNHPGMILPMNILDHRELHNEIRPIRPPIRILANLMLEQLRGDIGSDPVQSLIRQSEYLSNFKDHDSHLGSDARRIHNQYTQQIEFLAERGY